MVPGTVLFKPPVSYRWQIIAAVILMLIAVAAPAAERAKDDDTFSQDEIVQKASDFFELKTQGVGLAVEKIFKQYGRPNAYIIGDEGSAAVGVGLRYGKGNLIFKKGPKVPVYWQGPSVGFDVGANASKSFTLVYRLRTASQIFQRYPGVEGSYYFIGGIGVNYQQAGDVVLAPMRTGVGLRAGVNAGYLSYSRKRQILPF